MVSQQEGSRQENDHHRIDNQTQGLVKAVHDARKIRTGKVNSPYSCKNTQCIEHHGGQRILQRSAGKQQG